MKAERKFWTDAMGETVRPHVVLRAMMPFGVYFDASINTKTNFEAFFYRARLCNNGFRVGDPKCLLEDITRVLPAREAIPYPTNNIAYMVYGSGGVVCIDKCSKFHLYFWNLKKATLTLTADETGWGTSSPIATATIDIELDDYTEFYDVGIDAETLFSAYWDDPFFKYIKVDATLPTGDVGLVCGLSTGDNKGYLYFDETNIVSIDTDYHLDLISGEIPSQTLRVAIYDEFGDFDPQNPMGFYESLLRAHSIGITVGIDGAFLPLTMLKTTGEVSYSKNVLTIECGLPIETETENAYMATDFIGSVGDDLTSHNLFGAEDMLNYADYPYTTIAATSEPMPHKEISQLKFSSIGAFMVHKDSPSELYPFQEELRDGSIPRIYAHKASELRDIAPFDYHITARALRDTYAKLDRKPRLGNIKVTKYRYYITPDNKDVSVDYTSPFATRTLHVPLPEWCRGGARFEMTSLSAIDEDGNTVPQSSLNWTVNTLAYDDVVVNVKHVNVVNLVSATIVGTVYLFEQEALKVVSETVNSNGEECAIDNPFVTTDAQVKAIMDSVKYIYGQRDVYTAQWAQDWRVELGDIIYLDTQFEQNVKVVVTGLKFSYPGLWGEITMRRLG